MIIYLGEDAPEHSSDQAIDFNMDLHNPETYDSLGYVKSDELLRALTVFFRRPWFTSVWVIQEVAAASHAVMICGTRSFE